MRVNESGQPVGEPVPGWAARPRIVPVVLEGRTCRLEPLGEEHVDALFGALVRDSPGTLWTYLFSGPFVDRPAFGAYVESVVANPSLVPLAVVVDGRAVGHECWMRADPDNGSVEVGNIALGATVQRSTAATEASYLMMRHVFEDLGYRRYEWKCDSLNEPSRRAARRLGFRPEGTFRNAVVYKGRNRDTDWFSITDTEWVLLRPAYEHWLAPTNFDPAGRQRASLSDLVGAARAEG